MSDKINEKTISKIEGARNSLIQIAMKEIYESANSFDFSLQVFCVIAKFGLQNEAHKEGLIAYEEESLFELENKEQYLGKIHQFFIKYIR